MNSEERYNRWIDSTLPASERAALRDELAREGIEESERERVLEIGQLLRKHAPVLEHEDPFREQILDRIRTEQGRAPRPANDRSPGLSLVWSGLGLVTLAVLGFFVLIPKPWEHRAAPSEVYSVWSETDRVSAVALHTPDHSASVVWLDGLDYLPADHAVQ